MDIYCPYCGSDDVEEGRYGYQCCSCGAEFDDDDVVENESPTSHRRHPREDDEDYADRTDDQNDMLDHYNY